MTTTVALRFAYDGSCFEAYARDPALTSTVEGYIQDACRAEGSVEGTWRTGSRTDAGVSARMNVAKVTFDRTLRGLVPALNSRLPPGVWVTGVAAVDPDWNPRFAAKRTYRYIAPYAGEDEAIIRRACKAFRGTHHMGAFARVEEGRDPHRTIKSFEVKRDDAWVFTVQGPSFLWNQVRRMVGAALAIARGDATMDDLEQGLETGQHHHTFRPAPAGGLMLWDIIYDPALDWVAEAGGLHPSQIMQTWQAARTRADLMDALVD